MLFECQIQVHSLELSDVDSVVTSLRRHGLNGLKVEGSNIEFVGDYKGEGPIRDLTCELARTVGAIAATSIDKTCDCTVHLKSNLTEHTCRTMCGPTKHHASLKLKAPPKPRTSKK